MNKIVKIIIAAVLVAAVGTGIYFIVKPAQTTSEPAIEEVVESTETVDETADPEANG